MPGREPAVLGSDEASSTSSTANAEAQRPEREVLLPIVGRASHRRVRRLIPPIAAFVIIFTSLGAAIALLLPPVAIIWPADGTVDVARDSLIKIMLVPAYPGAGFDSETVAPSSVRLYPSGRPGDSVEVEVSVADDGRSLLLRPAGLLAPMTPYVVEVPGTLRDVTGRRVSVHSVSFRTSDVPSARPSGVQFEKLHLSGTKGPFTSLAVGPDGKLYGAQVDGLIKRWTMAPDGTLAGLEVIDALQRSENGPRLLLGLTFDPGSSRDSVVAWVTHTSFGLAGMADWGGKITRLSGDSLQIVQDFVVNLPRSVRDHVTNSAEFGPDDALYVVQGSNTTLGEPDPTWGDRPERLLSAAILRVDVAALDNGRSLPFDVKTAEGGTYDPLAPGAPVTIYAGGIRNAYDLVWHSNGYLYTAHNGAALGGATPPSVDGATRIDGERYTGSQVPKSSSVGVRDDYLFRITPHSDSDVYQYFGHPNPSRGEFVLDGGNPTSRIDRGEVEAFAPGTAPDPAWGGFEYNFGRHTSPTGMLEYRGSAFDGALDGHLVVTLFARRRGGRLIVLSPDSKGRIPPSGSYSDIPGLSDLDNPLDVALNPRTGDLYVSEYRGYEGVVLLRPAPLSNQLPSNVPPS